MTETSPERASKGRGGPPGRPFVSSDTDAWHPFAAALADAACDLDAPLTVISDVGDVEMLDARIFLRGPAAMERWEHLALERCRGRVLDLGAGAGPHTLFLQGAGLRVTAVDRLADAVSVMVERGVVDARIGKVLEPPPGPWDTVLLLMNGTMPFETLAGFRLGLTRIAAVLAEGGRILVDSTDLRGPGGADRRHDGRYVGEAQYQFRYGRLIGDPVPQLFLDPERLQGTAREAGLVAEVIWTGKEGHYLAEITRCQHVP